MDNKQFISKLAKISGSDYKETQALAREMFSAITDTLCDGDTVSIPGFGSFAPEKSDERIAKDLTDGKTYLFPPEIKVSFTESELLKKINKG